jgi:hypothetical protein
LTEINAAFGGSVQWEQRGFFPRSAQQMEWDDERYVRNCPVCRVAMIGEKADPEAGDPTFDRFVCFVCGTVIERAGQDPPEKSGE